MNNYIVENRNFVTASKLKEFIQSPEQYFLKYVKEIPSPKGDKEEQHFKIGTAFDDLISYGETEFYKKYWIDEGLKKDELLIKAQEISPDEDLTGYTVSQLKEICYGYMPSKIRLTAGEGEAVLGMYREAKRQPLWELNGKYEVQKTYTAKFGNLKLKGTLDRVGKGVIRDTKTTKNLDKFVYDWQADYGYNISMAFYWLLKYLNDKENSKLYLDVVQKTYPYPSKVFRIPDETIKRSITEIKEYLTTLDKMHKTWEETGDDSIWEIETPNVSNLEYYPILTTGLQKHIEFIS